MVAVFDAEMEISRIKKLASEQWLSPEQISYVLANWSEAGMRLTPGPEPASGAPSSPFLPCAS